MKTLTVQQPWAWAIIHGGKNIENRTQLWKYCGPLAIHAGARISQRGMESEHVGHALRDRGHISIPTDAQPWIASGALGDFMAAPLHLRAIIGVVDLVGAHWAHPHCCDGNVWAEQSYVEHGGMKRVDIVHLVLENPRAVTPIECKGRLGLWTPPADVVEAIGS